MKTCSKCCCPKPLKSFSKYASGKDGRHPTCKECRRKAGRDYYSKNKRVILKKQKDYRHIWGGSRQTRYGVSRIRFESMLTSQAYKCAICSTASATLCVDHNHETGRVRKLLCPACNSGLGMFKDSPTLLRLAADYLADGEGIPPSLVLSNPLASNQEP